MKQKLIYWHFFKGSIRKSLLKRIGKEQSDAVITNGKAQYRGLIERAPDLGKGNPFELNMYFACVFIGVWLGSEKELSPDEMAEIMAESLQKVKPFFSLINLNKASHVRWVQHFMADNYLKWYEKHGGNYPTWEMTGNVENKPGVCYTLRNCPICAMCGREGIDEIMPPLCALDSLMFSMMHGRLHREQTIASGGEMCDYFITGDDDNE